jgi:hypothetical protein
MEAGMDQLMPDLDDELRSEVLAFAAAHGLTAGEAAVALLRAGLEASGAATAGESAARRLERRLEDVWETLHTVGPAVLGVQRLIAHWAAQSGSVRLSEDELLAELGAVARDEWASQLAERGLLPPVDGLQE